MTRLRWSTVAVLAAGMLAIAGCSDDDPGSRASAPDSSAAAVTIPDAAPDAATTEQMVDLLSCTVSAEPGPNAVFTTYSCADPAGSGDVVYLYGYDESDADEYESDLLDTATNRMDEEKDPNPRPLATAPLWILDTFSQGALDVAVANGGVIVVEPR